MKGEAGEEGGEEAVAEDRDGASEGADTDDGGGVEGEMGGDAHGHSSCQRRVLHMHCVELPLGHHPAHCKRHHRRPRQRQERVQRRSRLRCRIVEERL